MTTQYIEIAKNTLLAPSGMAEHDLNKVLTQVMTHAIDSADIYFQTSRFESWVLEDGIVKEGSHNIEQGVGVRAISGDKTGFAYSDDIMLPALTQAAEAARAIAHHGQQGKVKAWSGTTSSHNLYLPNDPLGVLTEQEKIRLLERVDAEARRIDPRVKQVIVSLAGEQPSIFLLDV